MEEKNNPTITLSYNEFRDTAIDVISEWAADMGGSNPALEFGAIALCAAIANRLFEEETLKIEEDE